MLLTYFLNDFEIVPVAPIITGITFPHALYFYCKVFVLYNLLGFFLITFLSPEFATSINIHVPFSLSWIIMSGLLLGIVLSVCICWFQIIIIIIIIYFNLILIRWQRPALIGYCGDLIVRYFVVYLLSMFGAILLALPRLLQSSRVHILCLS